MPFTPYPPVDTGMNMSVIQDLVLKEWERESLEAKILDANRGGKEFIFLEGPPTANGRPHVGHAITRTVKDTVLRYKTMTGYRIKRRIAGWDCHGLAVEIEAEKHFGITQKQKIEELGIGKFNNYCRESAFRYIREWNDVDRLLGYSVDHEHPYITMNSEYIERVWWAVDQFSKKGLLYEDYKIVPYCPRCGTPLASHELSQGYRDVSDPSVFIKFRERDGKAYFLAWTTTPWTLPSNQFLAVSPEEEYSLVEFNGDRYYLLSKRISAVFGDSAKVITRMKGSDLKGKAYEQIIPFAKVPSGSLVVVAENFVDTENGTGIVHIAPAFGQDDFDVGKKMKVKLVKPVDESGKFSDVAMPWNEKFVKDADSEIIKYLKDLGLLFRSERITHSYPFCYRCDSPILYYPLDTWYLSVSRMRKELVANNEEINWYPSHLREGRFGNFISEAKDWALSRNRYWGSPLPVWTCRNGHTRIITSAREIEALTGTYPKDLHRPYIDDVKFPCENCGDIMNREPYVMDTWFDSGSATFAGLPSEPLNGRVPTPDLPVDFISEAIDQTRGWYYVLHVISSVIFGKPAFSNCITMDFVLDSRGKKMSKSKGNSVFGIDAVHENTGDELRLFFSTGAPWKTRNYDRKVIAELSRKNLYTLLNVYSFFASNANLDKFQYIGLTSNLRELDQWLISRVNSVVKNVRSHCDSYEFHLGMEAIQQLIDELSNFYLRLSRSVFWSDEVTDEKKSGYSALFYTLETISRLMAPWIPFFSDFLYMNLTGSHQSVHLQRFPVADEGRIKPDLEERLSKAYRVLELVRRARQERNLKARHPLKEILIYSEGISSGDLEVVSGELNARSIRMIPAGERPVIVTCKVNYNRVAPVLREKLKDFEKAVAELSPDELNRASKAPISKGDFMITPEDLILQEEAREGYAMQAGKEGIQVFINLEKSPDLVAEALAREITRRIQVMRKDLRLEYDDTISTLYAVEDDSSDYGIDLEMAFEKYSSFIKAQTLSSVLISGGPDAREGYYLRNWDIDGLKIVLGIKKN